MVWFETLGGEMIDCSNEQQNDQSAVCMYDLQQAAEIPVYIITELSDKLDVTHSFRNV